jgi:hypothetical protein
MWRLSLRLGVRGYMLSTIICSPLTLILSPQGERRFFTDLNTQAYAEIVPKIVPKFAETW